MTCTRRDGEDQLILEIVTIFIDLWDEPKLKAPSDYIHPSAVLRVMVTDFNCVKRSGTLWLKDVELGAMKLYLSSRVCPDADSLWTGTYNARSRIWGQMLLNSRRKQMLVGIACAHG